MGGDGGSIPGRNDLVRTKRKPEQVDKATNLAAKWKHCALSQEPLKQPIVACQLGRLYNKDKLIEYLLDSSKYDTVNCSHIKGLKDVKELVLTPNPQVAQSSKGDGFTDLAQAHYICPVTGLEMNGRFGFVFLWGCGCTFAEKTWKELKTEVCPKCLKPMSTSDVVIINGTDEEVELMRHGMEERVTTNKKNKKKRKADSHTLAKDADEASSSKVVKKDIEPKNEHGKIKKKTKTLQQDPNVSSVLKSLFTTSDACKNQPKAHWVTHNPMYY